MAAEAEAIAATKKRNKTERKTCKTRHARATKIQPQTIAASLFMHNTNCGQTRRARALCYSLFSGMTGSESKPPPASTSHCPPPKIHNKNRNRDYGKQTQCQPTKTQFYLEFQQFHPSVSMNRCGFFISTIKLNPPSKGDNLTAEKMGFYALIRANGGNQFRLLAVFILKPGSVQAGRDYDSVDSESSGRHQRQKRALK